MNPSPADPTGRRGDEPADLDGPEDGYRCPACHLHEIACTCIHDRAGRRRRATDLPTRGLL